MAKATNGAAGQNEDREPDFLTDVETRRMFVMMLSEDRGLLASLGEDFGKTEHETVLMALRALAAELCVVSLRQQEMMEQVAGLEAAGTTTGAMLAGLLGFEPAANDEDSGELTPDDVAVRKVNRIAQRTGAIIRESAGLEPLAPVAS